MLELSMGMAAQNLTITTSEEQQQIAQMAKDFSDRELTPRNIKQSWKYAINDLRPKNPGSC